MPTAAGQPLRPHQLATQSLLPKAFRGFYEASLSVASSFLNKTDTFSGTDAPDEFTLPQNVPYATLKLENHWQTRFTEADVQKLRATRLYTPTFPRIHIGF